MLGLSEAPVTRTERHDDVDEFRSFVTHVEQRLRLALVAAHGPELGRVAVADALSWAWEHWDRVQTMTNPAGYLYRVGRTAARRHRLRPLPPVLRTAPRQPDEEFIDPAVVDAVNRLPHQQRRVVLLVHAFGWSQQDVADLLGITPSSVKQALDRGVAKLHKELEEAR